MHESGQAITGCAHGAALDDGDGGDDGGGGGGGDGGGNDDGDDDGDETMMITQQLCQAKLLFLDRSTIRPTHILDMIRDPVTTNMVRLLA